MIAERSFVEERDHNFMNYLNNHITTDVILQRNFRNSKEQIKET